jgi:hypothetical protein
MSMALISSKRATESTGEGRFFPAGSRGYGVRPHSVDQTIWALSGGKNNMKRRSFLASGLAATGAASLLGVAPAAYSAPKKKPKNIRIALAAYSVREALTKTDYDLFKFIDWCSELDLDGVELTSYYFAKGFDSAYLRRLRNHAFHNGSHHFRNRHPQ